MGDTGKILSGAERFRNENLVVTIFVLAGKKGNLFVTILPGLGIEPRKLINIDVKK